jgi:hypothetical protein
LLLLGWIGYISSLHRHTSLRSSHHTHPISAPFQASKIHATNTPAKIQSIKSFSLAFSSSFIHTLSLQPVHEIGEFGDFGLLAIIESNSQMKPRSLGIFKNVTDIISPDQPHLQLNSQNSETSHSRTILYQSKTFKEAK